MYWGARVGVWFVPWSIANLQQTESTVLEANSITRTATKLRIKLVAKSYLPVVERPESFIRVLVSPKHQINTWSRERERERHDRCHLVKSYLLISDGICPYDWFSHRNLFAHRNDNFRGQAQHSPRLVSFRGLIQNIWWAPLRFHIGILPPPPSPKHTPGNTSPEDSQHAGTWRH